jgi:hypothetical protein
MDTWAKTTARDREALFTQAASVKGISPEIVEKDFWVCWILRQIFQLQDFPRLIFKGGTSLSKAFDIIKRFSEDVDLVINRHELGFNDKNDPSNQGSSNLRDRTIDKLKGACHEVIAGQFVPKLSARIRSVLGDKGWTIEGDPGAIDRETVEFRYPEGLPASLTGGYIKRVVRLELGCRGDQVPCEEALITPYAAEIFPEQFGAPQAKVNVISAQRTFWEKATILHREYHRGQAEKPPSERVFRHYHDVVVISKHERGISAMKDLVLLEQVAIHKQHFFREAAAHYELARKGTLRLAPSPQSEESLRKDCEKTREMYFGDVPDFDTVMNDLRELERQINDGEIPLSAATGTIASPRI